MVPLSEIENLNLEDSDYDVNYYLIAKKNHLEQEEKTVKYLQSKYNITFISLDKDTEGAACTVLFVRKYINNNYRNP